jgi:diacylglycerol kinase
MGLVLVAEMLNTALEYAIDLLHPDQDPLAGAVKDIAAGAVLVAALVAVIVAFCILGIPMIRWMVP